MRGITWADPEGVGEAGGPDPGKSQVIWVSIGNKQLDPPPPHPEKVGPQENGPPPLEPWKMIVFFESNHWNSVI